MSLRHLGIIPDGNRRWAKERGLPTIDGHRKGMDKFEILVNAAADEGIEYLTFYLFSTENWNRSEAEVSYLMKLVDTYIMKFARKLLAKNGKLLILGSKDRISPQMASNLEKAQQMTADCDGITVCFCFNYGGEQEIADAATIANKVDGKITPDTIRAHLYHPKVPNVDMIVRTSGEQRISGFMLWRAAYSEFMFIQKYFPEMEASDVKAIVTEYEKRNRRFGK